MRAFYSSLGVTLALAILGVDVRAQEVENGTFEENGAYSDIKWRFTGLPAGSPMCRGGLEDPAPGGGVWSVYLYVRNYQGGCFTMATQVLRSARSGDVWRVTAWAH